MQNKFTWFDLNSRIDSESEISCCLLRLFDLIKESLHLYFNIKNSQDIYDLLTQAERQNKDSLFIEWFLNKGIPKLKSIDLNNLPKDDRFLAMLELDEYILKSEMDFADPEEIRSCIISFVSSLQQYIDLCREELNEEYRVDEIVQIYEVYGQGTESWFSKPSDDTIDKLNNTAYGVYLIQFDDFINYTKNNDSKSEKLSPSSTILNDITGGYTVERGS
ncbi:hypothetical protein [Bacillus subtilis]|uniref:hypothetical protein n=1 Tax=Bacillus subtilis TaxID=1423 RepID=UPI001F16A1D9|nr:hypothetical protein [Bacillus subtilis]MCF7606568.1 hypothetical protein [Bacillus subtilis]MCF7613047.1 hypothetical protein [Bacillus subtilis]MDH3145454.1 hypothetical protein [Bacillus subtilis]